MKTLSPEELKRIEQLQLQIEWLKEGFDIEYRMIGACEWNPCHNPHWRFGDGEYRRKPAPRFVPWTREDAEEFRGIWVRENGFTAERMIVSIHGIGVGIDVDDISYISLFENFTKLDGTPCGKEKE